MTTDIEWCDETWNVTRGCRRVSAGCENCYAERQAGRFSGEGMPYDGLVKLVKREVRQIKVVNGEATGEIRTVTKTERRWTGKGRFVAEKLADPLRWKKPKRIFVDSMSDLFYEEFSNEQIAAVFGVMAACPQHTFMILTKRPKRMREWFEWVEGTRQMGQEIRPAFTCFTNAHQAMTSAADIVLLSSHYYRSNPHVWPLPNVWIGVSVENQAAADERIPDLLEVPAAKRFLSCEPLLGPLDLRDLDVSPHPDAAKTACRHQQWHLDAMRGVLHCPFCGVFEQQPFAGIDWVIIGCESGPGARPCDVAWIRSIVNQCTDSGVAVFLKQAREDRGLDGPVISLPYLDGKQYAEFPA